MESKIFMILFIILIILFILFLVHSLMIWNMDKISGVLFVLILLDMGLLKIFGEK